eukprot:scaffold14717_cov168-Ochromonas_danica.AAC.8
MSSFLWGDEIEYGVFSPDPITQNYDLYLNATTIREQLIQAEKAYQDLPNGCEWQPEYGSWMVEAVPKHPYGSYISDLLNVEKSMTLRRKRLHRALPSQAIAPTISAFPMLGVSGYSHTVGPREVSQSAYLSDHVINPHPRFAALTRNIRHRRGRNVTMQCRSEEESRYLHDQLVVLAPIFQALSAASPAFKGKLVDHDTRWDVISKAVDDRTVLEEGSHDPLPYPLPDPTMAGQGIRRLQKSRYSTTSLYLHPQSVAYQDIPLDLDEEVYEYMRQQGIDDDIMCKHIAHLFTRDPLVIFDDAIKLDNSQSLDHFESIQSTNWRSLRWKPPSLRVGLAPRPVASINTPPSSPGGDSKDEDGDYAFDHNILVDDRLHYPPEATVEVPDAGPPLEGDLQDYGPGWRVEFRPLEVQLTDFENAAFAILTVLTSRCLLNNRPEMNCYMNLSLVEENMRRAQLADAVHTQKFFFPKSAFGVKRLYANQSSANSATSFGMSLNDDCCCPKQIETVNHEHLLHDDDCECNAPKQEKQEIVSEALTGGSLQELEDHNGVEIMELSIDEIINGCPRSSFQGLLPALYDYICSLRCDDKVAVRAALHPYLQLLSARANGSLPTTASYLRNYIQSHPLFEGGDDVSPQVANDLLKHCEAVGMGTVKAPELYGNDTIIRSLAEVDEEDLMYANFTCFLRPVLKPESVQSPLPINEPAPVEEKKTLVGRRRKRQGKEETIRF